jgi:Ser/Thr protein kinase RdoA (MazF antagonist)
LKALRQEGFRKAPVPVGLEGDGRERLWFIEGDVPLTPYPSWAQSERALSSVAALMCAFHEAARSVKVANGAWNTELADPAGGSLICHHDVCLENVVFQDGIAVALLDFDFAAPGRAVYDLAQFARMCVPLEEDESAARLGWTAADRPSRLRLVADTYGLDAADRTLLLEVLADLMSRSGEFVLRRIAQGDANFRRMLEETGGVERFDRRRRWWATHKQSFAEALKL